MTKKRSKDEIYVSYMDNNFFSYFVWAGCSPPGLGTESDPYLMSELDHLVWLSETEEAWNSHFLQTNDIDATDTEN